MVPLGSFNPRTHTGCDSKRALLKYPTKVSIHAPTRGATLRKRRDESLRNSVSIHAPTRGATSMRRYGYAIMKCFNPRTHTGCDLFLFQDPLRRIRFNPRTHTGCDFYKPRKDAPFAPCFNPRTHTGCDSAISLELANR